MGYGSNGNGNGFGGWNYALIPSRKAQTVEEFVRVGSKVINLSKVVSVNLGVQDGDSHVTVFFDGGTRWTLYGAEADAVRRFFAGNAMTVVPDESEDPTVLGDGPCTECQSCRRKEDYADDFELRLDDDELDDDSLRFEDNIDDCE